MKKSYPPKELQAEIRSLLLRVGITPTRSIMDRVKSLTEKDALRAKGILVSVAKAKEKARSKNPSGRRATDRQIADWDRWISSTGTEVTPEALAYFLNLDTKHANKEIMNLRYIFWGMRDAKGRTTAMRANRGLVTANYIPGSPQVVLRELIPASDIAAAATPGEKRRLTFDEL